MKPEKQHSDERVDNIKPRISLCMIVRDEESCLCECLESVRGIIDEIVLVDTGSKDKTLEIAKSYGAGTYSYKWNDSFADARNEALRHASGDWILVMDADERLDQDAREIIARALTNPTADGYELLFKNYMTSDANPDIFTHRTCRLFRNNVNYRFQGRVHESVETSIVAAGGIVDQLDAVIHHYGYRQDMVEDRRKHERYVGLLETELQDNPKDIYSLYNLGVTYLTAEDYENALVHLQKAADHVTSGGELACRIFSCLAKSFCALGKAEEALAAVSRGKKAGGLHPELSYCLGNALYTLKRYQEAIQSFDEAIALSQRRNDWTGDSGSFGYKAHYGAALAYMALSNWSKAVDECKKVISEQPDDWDTHHVLAQAYLKLGRYSNAELHYLKLLRSGRNIAEVYVELGQLYWIQGRTADALQKFAEAVDTDPMYANAYFSAGDVLYNISKYQEAADIYQNALALSPANAAGFLAIGNCYFKMGACEAAVMAYNQAIKIQPDYSEAKNNLSMAKQALMCQTAA